MPNDRKNLLEQGEGPAHAYSFDHFRLDLNRQVLLCEGDSVTLRPKSFDVLKFLLENAGRVVSRDDLFEAVWPDRVVTDDSLTQCLIEIRKALGDEKRTLIKTIPRRGYLFDGEVNTEDSHSAQAKNTPEPVDSGRRLPSPWTLAALVVLAVAIAFTWWRTDTLEHETASQVVEWQPERASIAVLPFVDLSETGDQQYLAEGIAEEILNLLAQSPDLTVIARTSSFSFKQSNEDVIAIAQKLNVAHVLEGSVRRIGDRIRVTAQLVEGEGGVHLWSQTFDDGLYDVFAMQDRVATAVADILTVQLTHEGPLGNRFPAYTPNPQAWEIYLRGRLYYSRRGETDIMQAQRSFEEALAIDPQFADAWVSLAATYGLRFSYRWTSDEDRMTREEALPLIRGALEEALAINPNQPEALWRLAGLTWKTDPDQVIDLIIRAIELGHNHALVQAMMGGFLIERGLPELALPFLKRSAMLDPLSASQQFILGQCHRFVGRLDEAERILTHSLELNPTGAYDEYVQLAWINIAQEDFDSAAGYAAQIQNDPDRYMTLAILSHQRGQSDAEHKAVARLLALPPEEAAPSLAQVYAMAGDKDEAFRWLTIATDSIANSPLGYKAKNEVTRIQFSPFLYPLHEDERWQRWWSIAEKMFLDELDYQVIAFLKTHLERHPEMYGPIEALVRSR